MIKEKVDFTIFCGKEGMNDIMTFDQQLVREKNPSATFQQQIGHK